MHKLLNDIGEWSRHHRFLVFFVFFFIFCVGLFISARSLDFRFSTLSVIPAVIILIVIVPSSVFISGIELIVCGHALGARIGIYSSLRITALSSALNVLPLPAGPVARALALIQAGSNPTAASYTIIASAGLWTGMTAAISGFLIAYSRALESASISGSAVGVFAIAVGIFIAGFFIFLLSTIWLVSMLGILTTIIVFLLRIALLLTVILRLWLSFIAIDVNASFIEIVLPAAGVALGAAVAVVPAGLGISEGISATLAFLAGASPALTYLASSVSQIVGLVGVIVIAVILFWVDRDSVRFG